MMPVVLVFGAGGQVGRALVEAGPTHGWTVRGLARDAVDICDAASVKAAVAATSPDAVVNAAAYTAVDKAEAEPATAGAINTVAPGILADEAQRLGALLVHYSTDYVFDGAKPTPYIEDDVTAPLSAYGRSKRDGDLAIAASGARYLILRTSWVYGLHGANFMKTMLRLAREHDELRVVDDQIGAPTWTRHLADATAMILARDETPQGVYHLAAAGETSWHGYAEAIVAEARVAGLLEKLPGVRRITSADYPLPALRPTNSRLDCSRFHRDFGLALPDWRTGLIDCLADARF